MKKLIIAFTGLIAVASQASVSRSLTVTLNVADDANFDRVCEQKIETLRKGIDNSHLLTDSEAVVQKMVMEVPTQVCGLPVSQGDSTDECPPEIDDVRTCQVKLLSASPIYGFDTDSQGVDHARRDICEAKLADYKNVIYSDVTENHEMLGPYSCGIQVVSIGKF